MFGRLKSSNLGIFLRTTLWPHRRLLRRSLGAVLAFNILELLFPKLLQLYIDAVAGNPMRFLGLSVEHFI